MRSLSFAVVLLFSMPCLGADKLEVVAGGDKGKLKEPFGLDFLADGSVVLVEYAAHKVTHIDKAGKVTTLAGSGEKGLVDGRADKAQFNGPHNLAVAVAGSIYVADTLNHAVRKIDAKTRMVSTIAGTGKRGFAGDGGPAKDAEFNQTYHVALDREQKNLYVVDLGNKRVRKIDLATGVVNTVAGTGKAGAPPDGSKAIAAALVDPRACALDSKGRLYILERSGHALRVVEDGKIRTVVGNVGRPGLTGDNGPGVDAMLNGPKFLWIDRNDDVLIADTENHVIRRYIAKDGRIVRIAGTGKLGAGDAGPPLETALSRPHGVAEGPDGAIWIVDSENSRVLRLPK